MGSLDKKPKGASEQKNPTTCRKIHQVRMYAVDVRTCPWWDQPGSQSPSLARAGTAKKRKKTQREFDETTKGPGKSSQAISKNKSQQHQELNSQENQIQLLLRIEPHTVSQCLLIGGLTWEEIMAVPQPNMPGRLSPTTSDLPSGPYGHVPSWSAAYKILRNDIIISWSNYH